ncbi:MAG: glycosyltransferase family 39 protein [Chloroflexi bacterium]|nr:glycosyltransferase family 39 protein [Chloroflexota bacterium]
MKTNRSRGLVVISIVAAIAWLFAVTFNYYIVHKPFSGENALALMDAAANVFVALALFALAGALGRRVLRAFEFESPLERIVYSCGIGLGLISFSTLALGLAGLLNSLLFWLLLLVVAFLLRCDIRLCVQDFHAVRFSLASRFEKFLAGFSVLVLGIGFLFALTPPVAWDEQVHHLVQAKAAIELGRIASPPDILYFSFPSLGEMLFLAAMMLKGDIAAQLIHFGYLLLLLGALFSFASRRFNSSVAWLAVAVLVSVPSFLLVSTRAYVDVALAFYAFAAFSAMIIARESNNWRWYAFTGVFAGMAMGVKYTGAIVPLAIFLLLLRPFNFRRLAIYGVAGMLVAIPWYLRNLVFTGNPVYPFFFGGIYWDAFRANWFGRFGTGLMSAPLKLLFAPWDATVNGVEGALGFEATVGALMLALVPLLLLPSPKSKAQSQEPEVTHSEILAPNPFGSAGLRNSKTKIRDLFLFALPLYAFWLVGIAGSKLLQQTRLLFPAFPVFAILAAAAFDRLRAFDLPKFSLHRFARLVIILILALTAMSYAFGAVADNPLAYISGVETRAAFLARHLGDYDRAVQAINRLDSHARVLALWEPRSYYFRRANQPDAILDGFEHTLYQTRDAETVANGWRKAGYTHVLLNRQGLNLMLTSKYDPISEDDVYVLQQILSAHAQLVFGESLEIVKGEIVRASASPFAIYKLSVEVK